MEIKIEVQDEHEAHAIRMIIAERRRQDRLFGEQAHDPAWWYVIMGEEFGETGQAICDWRWGKAGHPIDDIRAEASQVAAVGVAMIQCLFKGNWVDQITTAKPSDRRQLSMALDEGHESMRYDEDEVEEDPYLCYHCGLEIRVTKDYTWEHADLDAYRSWLMNEHNVAHDAKLLNVCLDCGRDNVNLTHDALERTGHLNHTFNARYNLVGMR